MSSINKFAVTWDELPDDMIENEADELEIEDDGMQNGMVALPFEFERISV